MILGSAFELPLEAPIANSTDSPFGYFAKLPVFVIAMGIAVNSGIVLYICNVHVHDIDKIGMREELET